MKVRALVVALVMVGLSAQGAWAWEGKTVCRKLASFAASSAAYGFTHPGGCWKVRKVLSAERGAKSSFGRALVELAEKWCHAGEEAARGGVKDPSRVYEMAYELAFEACVAEVGR